MVKMRFIWSLVFFLFLINGCGSSGTDTEGKEENVRESLSFIAWDGIGVYEGVHSRLHDGYTLSTLYLNPLENGENSFVANSEVLQSDGVDVWYLISAVTPYPSDEYIEEQIQIIEHYNATHTKNILGISFDVEPWITFAEQNTTQNQEAWQEYLDFLARMDEMLKEKNLQTSVMIPFWLDTISEAFVTQKPLNDEVIDRVDEVVVMAYSNQIKNILSYAQSSLSYAQEVHKKVKIAVEMVASETDSISFYENPQDIQLLLQTPVSYTSFDGYVIHTLDAFYESGVELPF